MTYFYLRLKDSEPEILNCRNVSAVVTVYKEVSDLQPATRSSIATALEELNYEDSDTTVFCAWNTVSTSLHNHTTHRQSVWEARI